MRYRPGGRGCSGVPGGLPYGLTSRSVRGREMPHRGERSGRGPRRQGLRGDFVRIGPGPPTPGTALRRVVGSPGYAQYAGDPPLAMHRSPLLGFTRPGGPHDAAARAEPSRSEPHETPYGRGPDATGAPGSARVPGPT